MPTNPPSADKPKTPQLKILVSSTVYGYEDLLESIFALLETFGYDVLMSHKGTVPVDPQHGAMESGKGTGSRRSGRMLTLACSPPRNSAGIGTCWINIS